MSGGAIYQQAIRALQQLAVPLDDSIRRTCLAVLEAAQPGPLVLLYETGFQAGLPHTTILQRGAAIFLLFATGNLTDDQIDDECDYLTKKSHPAPLVQYIFHNWSIHRLLLHTDISPNTTAQAAKHLMTCALPVPVELTTQQWRLHTYKQFCETMAGEHWHANLMLMWDGTPLFPLAKPVGYALATPLRVAEDVRSQDPRFWSMPPEDRKGAIQWSLQLLNSLESYPELTSLRKLTPHIQTVLRSAIDTPSPETTSSNETSS